ncbi:MAG: carotenoid oxygenase family protein [Dehalococcoidia bacterium]
MTSTEPRVQSPFLEGNFAPVREEVTGENLRVIGELPADMDGMYVRTGPNPQFDVIKSYHWFGGDGMLHGVRVEGGKASYRNRFVQTEAYTREKAAGKALWGSGLGQPEFDNPNGPSRGNTGNTALVWHDGKLLTLWEGGDPHEIAVPGLETVGPYNYCGKLMHAFTAHPKVDERTGEMLFFGYNMMGMDMARGGKVPFLQYSVASAAGELVHTTPIDLPVGVMMHDFAVTERYSIFMNLPYTFSLERAMKGENPFAWEPDRGAHFGILARHGDGAQVRWFEAPACYVFHTLNAFEDGDEVVLDACRMARVDLGTLDSTVSPSHEAVIARQGGDDRARMHRWRFNLVTGVVKEERLDDISSDFPRVNDGLVGYKARFGYSARLPKGDMPESDGVIKYDLESGKSRTHLHGAQRSGGEPVFVPRAGAIAEDDGYLVTFVYDGSEGTSEFVVVDAQNVESAPLARVVLPQRVPYGFHGAWVSGERIADGV